MYGQILHKWTELVHGSIFKQEKARGLKAQPLQEIFFRQRSKCEQKIANTHPNKSTHPHTQTSELDDYNKLSLWLSLKMESWHI